MRKINILYIIGKIFHISGGTERNLSYLTTHLDKNKFDVHLAALTYTQWLDTDYFPCTKFSLNMKSLSSFSSFLKICKLRRYIKKRGINIIQTFFLNADIVGALASRKIDGKILISSRRDTGYWHNSKTLRLSKIFNRYFKVFLANSRNVVREVCDVEGLNPLQFKVIYNGIDPSQFHICENAMNETKDSLGIDRNDKVVGLVANFRPVKDIKNFIKACAFIKEKQKNVRFLIIGTGDEDTKREIFSYAEKLCLLPRLLFLGMIENPMPFVRTFDIGVLSSVSEGFSNSLLEYGALGIPSVATNVGGNPEIIKDIQTGLLVPPKDSLKLAHGILTLLNDDRLRSELGQNSYRRINNKFTLMATIKSHQELYENLYSQENNG